jgi:hypothetical protein
MSHNNSDKKVSLCRYGCSKQIKFDDTKVGKNGRRIPLNLDGTRHDCPFSPHNQANQNLQTQVQQIDTTIPLFAEMVRQLKIANEFLEDIATNNTPKNWQTKYK